MSKSPLDDLSQYNQMANGPLAALALKSREALMRMKQQQDSLIGPVSTNQTIGDVTTNQPRMKLDVGMPTTNQVTTAPIAFNIGRKKPTERDQLHADINRMFLPVEQGGSLITTATPVNMVGGSLPDGYGFSNVPKAVLAKIGDRIKLPDGVKPIGFHPGRMNENQFKAIDWFNQQRDSERQAEADAEQKAMAANQQQNK